MTRISLLAGAAAGAIGFGVKFSLGGALPPILLLALGVGIVFSVYACVLVAMGQTKLYLDILTELFSRTCLRQ